MPAGKLLVLEFESAWIHARLHQNYNERWYCGGNLHSSPRYEWISISAVHGNALLHSSQPLPIQSLENIYLRGSPTGHAKPRDTSEQSFSSSHRAFAALVGHDGQSVNQHYLRWTNKRITLNDLTICKQSNSAAKWSNTVQPLLANSGFDRLKGTSSKMRCFEAPCLQSEGTGSTACWRLRYWLLNVAGWTQKKVILESTKTVFCCQDARTTPPWQASGNAKTCYDQKGKLQGFKARVFQGQEPYDQETIWNNVASQILIEKEDKEVELWWEFIISGEKVTSGSTGFGDRPAN